MDDSFVKIELESKTEKAVCQSYCCSILLKIN